jgi:hypothetical protein
MRASQPLLRVAVLSLLSFIAVDQGHLGEEEPLARRARALVDGNGLRSILACPTYSPRGNVLVGEDEPSCCALRSENFMESNG